MMQILFLVIVKRRFEEKKPEIIGAFLFEI